MHQSPEFEESNDVFTDWFWFECYSLVSFLSSVSLYLYRPGVVMCTVVEVQWE
jgi:hypothetical protein